MPITRTKKQAVITALKEKAANAKLVMFLNFHGLKAEETSALRQSLREEGVGLTVAKKTLIGRALNEVAPEGEAPLLEGEVAVMDVPARAGGPASTGTEDDPLAAARKLYEFVKQFNERLRILGAVFSGRYQGAEAATALAQIPGRQVLLGRLAGMLAYPTRKLVITCGQIRKQKENQSN